MKIENKFRQKCECQNGHKGWLYFSVGRFAESKNLYIQRFCNCPSLGTKQGYEWKNETEILINGKWYKINSS